MDYMQNRLTDKEYADARRKEYESGLSKGGIRDRITERYLKLAAYEDACLTPSDIQEVVDILASVFPSSDIPTEFKSWMTRCVRHARECDELRKELDAAIAEKAKLEAELSIAKEDIAAILWLNGECRYCKNARRVRYSGAERIECALEKGSDCRPEWNGGCT